MRAFQQVDVFTQEAGLGNPVAVVLDGEGLSDAQMAGFARWTNLSETTFVLPAVAPEADYRVRIFTPSQELPFAGHPTLGTCHALLEAGRVSRSEGLVQECEAGLIPIRVETDGALVFAAPPAKTSACSRTAEELAALLGGGSVANPLLIDVGPRWLTLRLTEPGDMDRIQPDYPAIAEATRSSGWDGITAYAISSEGGVEVRSFAPADGIDEDPVCGSGNAAVGHHLRATGAESLTGESYVARQGRFLQRDGRIRVRIADRVEVGGHCISVIVGSVAI
ncbi:MAG: PhzF family phenazine biosynthesis protein [Deltaproteobacteria bacterium]|nr:PhzF family phenazine biosynthesis protein [Deltaproteobacteria bacterium]